MTAVRAVPGRSTDDKPDGESTMDINAGDEARTSSEVRGAGGPVRKGVSWIRSLPGAASRLLRRMADHAAHQPAKAARRLGIGVLVMALVAGGLGYLTLRYSQTDQARQQAVTAAKDAVVPLLSYNYRTIDRQVATTQALVTGKFKDDYAALVRDHVIGTSKAQAVSIQTQVVSASAGESGPNQVVVLMFVNQQTQVAGNTEPALTGSRLKLTMSHVDDRWMVSDLAPV